MTTDRRAQVVEAMAQALARAATRVDATFPEDWEAYTLEAEAALEAALDVLGRLSNAELIYAIRETLRAGKGSE